MLIAGISASGKSASLRNLENPEGVMYLGTEAGKRLPFKNKFKKAVITSPLLVPAAFTHAEQDSTIHTIVVDSLTFLMDMFESQHVIPHAGTSKGMTAWSDYGQFFKNLMQVNVASSTKTVIFTAHNLDEYDENAQAMRTNVPVKGALKGNGIESYFSCVLYAKKMPIKDLEKYVEGNKLLTITEEERELGYKHVFQTNPTKDTVNSRIRSPMGMWSRPETFIDNDANLVKQRLTAFYSEE